MSVDQSTVARIAALARIKVSDDERARLARELDNIIGWVESLAEVNTDGVEPMAGFSASGLRRRPDEPDAATGAAGADAVLANAPEPEDGFFTVPKVVE